MARLKGEFREIAYFPFNQGSYVPVEDMTFALRTSGDPLRYVNTVRGIVSEADARVPVTDVKTQAAQIDQTMNQEILFAKLCTDLRDSGIADRLRRALRHDVVHGCAAHG